MLAESTTGSAARIVIQRYGVWWTHFGFPKRWTAISF